MANFWATRSHALRAEAEEDFRMMCLEFPQFGYDVLCMLLPGLNPPAIKLTIKLARVLDEKLKREKTDKLHLTPSSSRKRSRGI